MVDTAVLIEIFGYIGSALVVISMLMSSVVKLRVINMVGSVISGIYALISGALPLVVMNLCLLVINFYNLYKLLKTTKEYDLVVGDKDDAILRYFLDRYEEDIKTYFPGFGGKLEENDEVYVVCCNGTPAGVTVAKRLENEVLDLVIDYTTPAYRDCSVAKYLYSELAGKGVKVLQFAQQECEAHVAYLNKMGYVREKEGYRKVL